MAVQKRTEKNYSLFSAWFLDVIFWWRNHTGHCLSHQKQLPWDCRLNLYKSRWRTKENFSWEHDFLKGSKMTLVPTKYPKKSHGRSCHKGTPPPNKVTVRSYQHHSQQCVVFKSTCYDNEKDLCLPRISPPVTRLFAAEETAVSMDRKCFWICQSILMWHLQLDEEWK